MRYFVPPGVIPLGVAAFVSAFLLAGVAQAGFVGYEARFFGNNTNIPRLQLSNVSDSASIVEFVLTLNRDAFEFDYARVVDSTGNVAGVLVDPEALQGGHRSDKVHYRFDAFDPGATFTFKTDVDPKGANQRVDFRSALFDFDGGAPSDNADLRVRFSDGTKLWGTWPSFDPESEGSTNFGQSRTTPSTPPTVVPLPGGAWAGLGLLAIASLAGAVRRRTHPRD